MNRAIEHVYVHFPYCLHRCAYCDFATTTARVIPRERYLAAILRELALRTPDLTPAPLRSVFFGGGTPSLWGPANVGKVLAWLTAWAGLRADAEVTLEANPGALESGDLAAYAAAGINRVSVGIQALDDGRLRQLDRLHDASAARQTLDELAALLSSGALRSASADLIFGVPGQTLADLRADLTQILDRGLPHLSAYALTVEPGTPLARQVQKSQVPAPDEALQTRMLDWLPDATAPWGLRRYEVSNYAKPGDESRHNLAYWTGKHYLAVGVGAHGFVPHAGHVGRRYGNTRKHDAWLRASESDTVAEDLNELISPAQHLDERLLTGMRLAVGVDLSALERDLGSPAAAQVIARSKAGRDRGDLWMNDGHLGVEPAALRRLDSLVAELA